MPADEEMSAARRVGKIVRHGDRTGTDFDGDFAHAVRPLPNPPPQAGEGREGAWASRPRRAALVGILTAWARCPPYVAAAFAAFISFSLASVATAQPQRDPGEIHGLKLGLKAAEMSTDTFGDLACGSNGGPPRQAIDEWADFRKCRPEPSGLYEVNVRFDDQQEYIGRAIDDPLFAQGRIGTRVAGHPVILSVLFDRDGILRGIRMVSDPRASITERRMAHMLRIAVINRYEPDGWMCTDFPPAGGETPVGGGVFIKQRCEKHTAERDLMVEAHFLRKPGQSEIDPATGEPTSGQFESWTRFEIIDPNYKKPAP
jgi:hypothetical protein